MFTGLSADAFLCSSFTSTKETNPLIQMQRSSHATIPWNQIKLRHFRPALIEAARESQREVDAILEQTAEPSFENTILPLSRIDTRIEDLSSIFTVLWNARRTNPEEMAELQNFIQQTSTDVSSSIYTNKNLFDRVKPIHEKRSAYSEPQKRLIESIYLKFIESGIALPEAQRARIQDIKNQMGFLKTRYDKLTASYASPENFLIVVKDPSQMEGLPENIVAMARKTASDQGIPGIAWAFQSGLPLLQAVTMNARSEALRKEYWEKSYRAGGDRGPFDAQEVVRDLIALRHEMAQILGFETFADWALNPTMAQSPGRVLSFLKGIEEVISEKAEAELEILRQRKIWDTGDPAEKLMPWDIHYYRERVREEEFSYDSAVLSTYFELNNVMRGAFLHAKKLFNLEFILRSDLPTYEGSVQVFEVKQNDVTMGFVYFDLFARQGQKLPHNWVFRIRSQGQENGERVNPFLSLNLSLTRSEEGPIYLSRGELRSFFHEFGHALHEILSNVEFSSQAGTKAARDFIELPSTFMENFLSQRESLDLFAKNEFGETIPEGLFQAMLRSEQFGRSIDYMRMLEISLIDLELHYKRGARGIQDLEAFEAEVRKNIMISAFKNLDQAPLISTFLSHIITHGYETTFYGYLWSDSLAYDAFSAFKKTGNIFDATTSARLEKLFSAGGSNAELTSYTRFRGREPSNEAFLEHLVSE